MLGSHLETPDAPPDFIMLAEMVSPEQRRHHKAFRWWP